MYTVCVNGPSLQQNYSIVQLVLPLNSICGNVPGPHALLSTNYNVDPRVSVLKT